MDAQLQIKAANQKIQKWIYSFGKGRAEGDASMKLLLGGKGANLAEMNLLGLNVPSGFTITTDICQYYYNHNRTYPKILKDEIKQALSTIEQDMGSRFGCTKNPLLISVRSGAPASMPGMMDTILNLGLNDKTIIGLIEQSGDSRFAYDSYRRFIQMYSAVVLDVEHYYFEEALELYKKSNALKADMDLSADHWKKIVEIYKNIVLQHHQADFPQDIEVQLYGAINAVFDSWMNPRAITYRKINLISKEWGTAINIQAMVFGNMGEDCATGVAFTRCPSTGQNKFFGEYLINAQGEDVVAGIRTPCPLNLETNSLEKTFPKLYAELLDVRSKLEMHYKDMQDIEFTIQKEKLYMLQTRSGKRTTAAALKIAIDLAKEGLISKQDAILRIDPQSLDQLLHPTLDIDASKILFTKGLPASPGAATGKVVFCADEAEKMASMGLAVILCRKETCPDDIHGMHAAKGILTCRGGMTSHAAVVARGIGRPCIVGASECNIDFKNETITAGGYTAKKGDFITLNGAKGEVYLGKIPTLKAPLSNDFKMLMSWADEFKNLTIRTNAETALEAKTAIEFGAEGIGLCRTEHMFFDPARIPAIQEMILSSSQEARKQALARIIPMQRDDFIDLFKMMENRPITIRLLDPPLHEFLPHSENEIQTLATHLDCNVETIKKRTEQLSESNPMLGHRGCRLGLTYPEIYESQVQAIFEAAIYLKEKEHISITPEIMIPLISTHQELKILKEMIHRIAATLAPSLTYQVGTMIELPRAALQAGKIALEADFFSFGTNDLTQTTFGMSRDDSTIFLSAYEQLGIMQEDPFSTLDQDGVGELIKIAVERGRAGNPNLKLGLCGEHGGDPKSIQFCEEIGLDYVSCSPYRVPIARLAAAQAALKTRAT